MGRLVEGWRTRASGTEPVGGDPFRALSRRTDGKLRVLVHDRTSNASSSASLPRPDMTLLRPGLLTWTAAPEEILSLSDAYPQLRVSWAAPRRVLLDVALPLVRADVVQRVRGLTGRGVAVGIVDTGVDVVHADLRRADGSSRIAWLLDLSHPPTGKHPELEQEFGCNESTTPCAVFSSADLDELISNGVANDEPRDSFGHGTHVASLAAGNGLSSPEPKYVGVAPEATFIAVRATRDDSGAVEDPDILNAVKFIFAMADKLAMPVVVNLSLGGDFGAHDGTSELERELEKYVGPSQPGHSVVVAAGNSGALYESPIARYPSPVGIHTVAHVPPKSSVKVPMMVSESADPKSKSYLYVWIATRPGDWLKVGLADEDGTWIAPVDLNGTRDKKDRSGDYTATIQNGVTESDDPSSIDHSGAAVLIEGPFSKEKVFTLLLEGYGTASIWLQPAGGIDPMLNGMGALVPGAQREGTISIPATSPALISVGASLNRVNWTDANGENQLSPYVFLYAHDYLRPNTVLPFSSGGPNAVDALKPDVVAPGGWVAGAMSSLTDPRTLVGENAMFAGSAAECESSSQDCLVVDNSHALSTGTSMASPIVAGAVALLFQSDPKLTQTELARALRAGAKVPVLRDRGGAQLGAGLLDVENALVCLQGVGSSNPVNTENSWIGLGNSYVHPDPKWPFPGFVHLRDANDTPVDIPLSRLQLRLQNGQILSDLVREGLGFYRFTASGSALTAGQTFQVDLLVDGTTRLSAKREIALDATSDREPPAAGNGCSFTPARQSATGPVWLGLLWSIAASARKKRAFRRAESRS
ncbi:MAG TPA: S8 family serine peptidase [Polyangiaceae bacterium]|nr:S8 family serine peptidase [Polyangiaceae bacterium]